MENHHAFITYASALSGAAIPEALKVQSVDTEHIICGRFSIDDARALSMRAQQTPLQSPNRVFVIVCEEIAPEAQNALLKLFEEPPVHTLFYVVLPQTAHVLPTLRSRFMLLDSHSAEQQTEDFALFAEAAYAKRVELIGAKTKDKDTQWVESIVQGCERAASETRQLPLMKAVLFVRRYIKTRGASPKMLLEELALLLPRK